MTNMINGYILYRLMVDKNNKTTRPRRHSLMPISMRQKSYASQRTRNSLIEPFCAPVIQHVPIRQRLSSVGHDSSSVETYNDLDPTLVISSNPYPYRRRRRMSLLQTLRHQNRLLADSGVECRSQQSDQGSEIATKTHHSSNSSPFSSLETKDSRRRSSIVRLKNKTFAFFGKYSSKRSQIGDKQISSNGYAKCCQNNENDQPVYSSIDLSAKEVRHGKSPSTNDSGHESQGQTVLDMEQHDDKNYRRCSKQQETVAVIERSSEIHSGTRMRGIGRQKYPNLIRSLSCPQLGLNLLICREICRRTTSNRQEFISIDEIDSEEDIEDREVFMPITEKSLITDKEQSKENVNDHTSTKSLQSSSCDATDCIIEKEEFRYAAKLNRNFSLLEGQEDSANDELSSKFFSQQQQKRQQHLRLMKKLRHLKLRNGYVTTGQLAHVSSKFGRNSSLSRISTETMKQDDEEVDEKSLSALSAETISQCDIGKGHYPELDSFASFYLDNDEDDDNLSSLMLDHYLPPKCGK
uniref:Uncharacterized protein n=1 Tax=Onchocerca volvulus TaxID=6282 RepID=A0A8R1U1D8_ONCVO